MSELGDARAFPLDASNALRRIGSFVARVVVVYVLLVLPWPGLESAWGQAYRAAVRALAASFELPYELTIGHHHGEDPRLDVEVRAEMPGDARIRLSAYSSRYYDFLAVALLAALVFATPVSWTSRAVAFALGTAAFGVLVALRWVAVLLVILAPVPPREPVRSLLATAHALPWFLIPVVFWAGFAALAWRATPRPAGAGGDPMTGGG